MNELHLTLEHVAKSYARPVLRDVNLTVTNDSYVTILGKSGSGKSTMLNIWRITTPESTASTAR